MADLLTCAQGHQWDPQGDSSAESPGGQYACPVCGAQAQTLSRVTPTSGEAMDAEASTLMQAAPSSTELLAEQVSVPGYEILGRLVRGGTSMVYKARQISLNRPVALKMILAGAHAAPQQLARFRSEAEALARLQHPHIVQIYEVGHHNGCPYLALEFMDGGSLAQRIDDFRLPQTEARPDKAKDPAGPSSIGIKNRQLMIVSLMETLARAVHYAHQRGIIHRDLKPANILLQGSGIGDQGLGVKNQEVAKGPGPSSRSLIPDSQSLIPKLTDFGMAKQFQQEGSLTRTGDIMGTPSYMAPEQAAGNAKAVGPATDVYGLGAILYELLTGRPPFRGTDVFDTLEQVRSKEPTPPGRLQPRGCPRDLETICLKCLHKDPRQRYANAETLADDLARFRTGESIHARPPSVWERFRRWAKRRREVALVLVGALLAIAFTQFINFSSKTLDGNPAGAKNPTAQQPLPLPDDLKLVPPDATGFISIRVADLLDTDGAKRLQQRMTRDQVPAIFRKWSADLGRKLVVDPSEIERATLVLLNPVAPDESFLAIIATTKPYAKDQLRDLLVPGAQEKTHAGKTYYFSANPEAFAAHFAGDQVFVVASPPEALEEFLDRLAARPERGPLDGALQLAAEKHENPLENHHVVVGLKPPAGLLEQFQENEAVRPLAEMQAAALTLKLESTFLPASKGDSLLLDLRLTFPSEAIGKQGQEGAIAGVKLVQTNLRQVITQLARDPGKFREFATVARLSAELLNEFEFALQNAKVEQKERDVHVLIHVRTDLTTALAGGQFDALVQVFSRQEVQQVTLRGAEVLGSTLFKTNVKLDMIGKIAESADRLHFKKAYEADKNDPDRVAHRKSLVSVLSETKKQMNQLEFKKVRSLRDHLNLSIERAIGETGLPETRKAVVQYLRPNFANPTDDLDAGLREKISEAPKKSATPWGIFSPSGSKRPAFSGRLTKHLDKRHTAWRWRTTMSSRPEVDYEHLPGDGPLDETDVSLRAYLGRLSDEHLARYNPAWTDEQVMAWDGNFRSDGGLMLVCCERDVDVHEFRRALEEHLTVRGRPSAAPAG